MLHHSKTGIFSDFVMKIHVIMISESFIFAVICFFFFFVQLLTMRNGVSLYPMCLPGILQSNEISHMRMGYSEGRSRSLNVNNMTRATTSLDQTTAPSNNIMFTLPGHYPNQEQTSSIPNLRKLSDSDSFGLGSSTQVHSESFQLQIPGSSKVSSV